MYIEKGVGMNQPPFLLRVLKIAGQIYKQIILSVPLRLVIDRFSQVYNGEFIENMMPVVVKNPQVIGLTKIAHDHVIMVPILLFYHIFRNFISDELLYPLC